jgi:hypothetical protein
MTAILAALLPQLLPYLLTAISSIFVFFKAKADAAATSADKATKAGAQIATIGLTVAGDVWARIGPQIQASLADGKLDSVERQAILDTVEKVVAELDVSGTISKIAAALGLPLSGVIGTIGEWVIDHFAKAHDAANQTVSSKAYPVAPANQSAYQGSSAVPPAGLGSARAG